MTRRPDFQPPPVLDLRQSDLRPVPTVSTIITVHADYRSHEWIHAKDIELTERDNRRGLWDLRVKVRGATDFEHDTAIALSLDLTGVAFRMTHGGRLWLDGYIAGDDPDMFRVPEPDWDQMKGATKCKNTRCLARGQADRHVVVAEDRYIPPPNEALFERLRGLRVEIVIGVAG